MRSLSILAAVLSAAQALSSGKSGDNLTIPSCNPKLSDTVINRTISDFSNLLTLPRYNATTHDQEIFQQSAHDVLDPSFTFYSDSFGALKNTSGVPRWRSAQEFMNDSWIPLLHLQTVDYWYDCSRSKIGWRWNATMSVFSSSGEIVNGTNPIRGLTELQLGSDSKIMIAWAEFNTAAWYRNVNGKSCN